jgi:hypothetical protein
MRPIPESSLIESILVPWRSLLDRYYDAYRGHVYRQLNYALRLIDARGGRQHADAYGGWDGIEQRVAVAAASHDVGVFADGSMDYLEPPVSRMRDWLKEHDHMEWFEVAALMSRMHHKLTRYRGKHEILVEAFRRADLTDLSFGTISSGVARDYIRSVVAEFPYAGFQWEISKRIIAYGIRHPSHPLPMLRR